jgi:hypothetical protein
VWNTYATPVARCVARQCSMGFSRFFSFAVALRPIYSMARANAGNLCITLFSYRIAQSRNFNNFFQQLP